VDSLNLNFSKRLKGIELLNLYKESGRVKKVLGPIVEGYLPGAVVGGICTIATRNAELVEAEIVGFRDRTALLMPSKPVEGIAMGARIEQSSSIASVKCGEWMRGKLLNGLGEPMTAFHSNRGTEQIRPVRAMALSPLDRASINSRLLTGVRAIDSSIPVGMGQRLGIMAASGVGKSVLMGMLARQSTSDLNVIALIGERGREVTEFLERDLGPEGMKKSIVISVTSDESPVLKVRGAYVATTIAEYFRDKGLNVLFMMDSVTRFGMALREIGLAAGEPPTSKGYTPSVFNQMPRLLERAGAKKNSGSITGFYTVLVEGNDFDDPIADNVKSIVDGHIVLSRDLAARNHYPAIDILQSVSRLTGSLLDDHESAQNAQIRQVLATYKSAEDLINIGGYRKGNNAEWDKAIDHYPKVTKFLKQGVHEVASLPEIHGNLDAIFGAKQ